jgi:calpain-5
MEFSDFLYYFNEVSICRLINTSLLTIRKTWTESYSFGKWSISSSRAGGCVNYLSSFCNNPQYLFEVDSADKPDDVIINLDQLSLRFLGKDTLTMGFFIMRVEDNRKYRLHKPKAKTTASSYINRRSVFVREKLPTGRYILIPSTFEPNIEGEFLLRIYTDNSNNLKYLIALFLFLVRFKQIKY